MSKLMLHCGAQEITREDVYAVRTPDVSYSETGRGYHPVPHSLLIETVEENLREAGLSIVNQEHALANDGMRYFGTMEVVNGHQNEDHGLIVGVRNGHDKSFPAGVALGARVFVCDNLSFSGEVQLARKHTRYIKRDLPHIVAAAVGMLQSQRVKQETRIAAYKDHAMDDSAFHDFVIRAVDTRAIPLTRIPDLLGHWRKPPHEEFEARTLWSAFNGFTEIFKSQQITTTLRRSQVLHGLADATCGLVLPSAVEIEDGSLTTTAA